MTTTAHASWVTVYEEARANGYSKRSAQLMADDSIAPVFGRWLEADRVHAEALFLNADRDDDAAWERVYENAMHDTQASDRDGFKRQFGTQIHAYAERVLGRGVCTVVAHDHRTLEAAGDCGEPLAINYALSEAAAANAEFASVQGQIDRAFSRGAQRRADSIAATGDPRA